MNFLSKLFTLTLLFIFFVGGSIAQDVTGLVQKVKAKIDIVNDYVAEGKMKTDVAFIKAPVGKIKVFFKKPDLFKIKREGGISILPKGGVTLNLNNLITTNEFVALFAGETMMGKKKIKVIKLIPTNEKSEVILSTLYINEEDLLIMKAATTTKENGSFEMEFTYGKFAQYSLPDKVVFSFNTKDYKIPKGVTLEFDETVKKTEAEILKARKGRVELQYANYQINTGLTDAVFKK
ncbi:MAG: hypothetical protein ACOVNR_10465 [Chitinophagaceae bacterium]